MNKKYIVSLLILAALPSWLLSQITLKGRVTDASTGEPLIGATVVLTDNSSGAMTDENGNFNLQPSDSDRDSATLRVTYLGYLSTESELTHLRGLTAKTVKIALAPNAQLLQAITVTAFRKMQVEQLIPMATTTLPALQLRRSNAKQFRDYAAGISNLAFNSQGAGLFGRFDNGISIRGIQGKNTTAIYLDETPLPPNLDPRLVNARQVEVLKGPQGTLYGSRNMGGAVKIIGEPCDPTALRGFMETSVAKVAEGDLDFSVEGSVNFPLGEKAAVQWAGFHDFQTGVFDRKFVPGANVVNRRSVVPTYLPDGSPFDIRTDGCLGCDLRDRENVDNKANSGFSATLVFFPTKKISLSPAVTFQHFEGDGYDFAEGQPGNFTQTRSVGGFERFEDAWKLYSFTGIVKTRAGRFVSSTSLLDRRVTEVDDYGETISRLYGIFDGDSLLDFFAGDISKIISTRQFTQELRFESNFPGRLNFTAGAFYTDGRERETWLSAMPGAAAWLSLFVYEDPDFAVVANRENMPVYDFDGTYRNRETAVFGEIWFNFSKKLKVAAGLRLFKAELGIDAYETGYLVGGERSAVGGSSGESGFVPRLNLSYELVGDKLLYANVSKGYRLGDLNNVVPDVFCAPELEDLPDGKHPRTYESDFLWNYEIGLKSTWWGGRLTANAAVFYNDWQNLQQSRTLLCGYNYISNIGSAHTLGAELDLRAKLSRALETGGGLGYLNTRIDESGPHLEAAPGDRILFTPTLTGNFYAQFSHFFGEKKSLYLRGGLQYVGERLGTFSPEDPEQSGRIYPAYALANARAGLTFPDVEFFLFAKNLTNAVANYGDVFPVATDFPGRVRYSVSRPLTVGVGGRLFF